VKITFCFVFFFPPVLLKEIIGEIPAAEAEAATLADASNLNARTEASSGWERSRDAA